MNRIDFKIILSTLAIIIFCLFIISCSSDDDSSPLKGQTISDQIFETGTNTKTVTLGTKDLSNCTVSSNADWCKASINLSSIIITVQPNETYEDRQATITLSDIENATTLSFRVFQNQNDAILVDTSRYIVPEEGGVVSIKVLSNVKYLVEIPSNATWLTNSSASTRGLSSSTIELKAEYNNSGDEREAVVRLTDIASRTTSQITILQGLTPVVTLDKNEYVVDEMGGEIEVEINSNIDLETNYNDEWVSSGGRIENGDYNFIQKVKVSPLSVDKSNRSTVVSFRDKKNKWNITKEVSIKQIKSFSIQDTNVDIYIGESFSLNLLNKNGGSVIWETSDSSVAIVNDKGEVTGVGSGIVTITVTTEDGKLTDKITITVKDIQSYITGSCSTGMTFGSKITYDINCFIMNNSNRKIEVKKFSVYHNAEYINGMSDLDMLVAEWPYGLSFSSTSNITNNTYTFIWEYVFAGNTYELQVVFN